jgi:hypothetical protein
MTTTQRNEKAARITIFGEKGLNVKQYHSYMFDWPTRSVYENGRTVNSYWKANLSLVNIHDNNSSLIIFSYGYSIKKGNYQADRPTAINKSN